jgi:hypothetical protein
MGSVLYVAGSHRPWTAHGAHDWFVDDAFRVPFNRMRTSTRYHEIDAFVKANPQVHTLVGHSLGSAAIGAWLNDNPDWQGRARLHNWPTLGHNSDARITSFSDYLDPISMGDRTAKRRFSTPHSYQGPY